ncbi:cytochrome-c peroxidase [Bryobacter aggregatus]|uniref:cytochrome-c peroxidase n=1 Tax=Bryobacter aggregatus TaxID=360054 RepID=UPI0004E13BFF|nr:cytochrome c peroxidase [Bryobacter aggregatus]
MKKTEPLLATLAGAMLILGATVIANAAEPVSIDPSHLKAFKPLPESSIPGDRKIEDAQVSLGRILFYDTRFSKSQTISCNSCHNLSTYGVDNQPTSTGFQGQKGGRNSPTVYNAAGHFLQFWDGRAKDVEEQAKGPVLNPVEMAMASDKEVLAIINSMPEYVTAFQRAFPGEPNPVTYDNFGIAIGAFERKLLTPSRWDKFLAGDQKALTNAEKAGFNAYYAAGCASCHAGAYLGGNLFQKVGAKKTWPNTSDSGRREVTKNAADDMMFKVPSLRNIAKTGPYFHDGKTVKLSEAIEKMGEYQLGQSLTPQQVASIEVFLNSLTGQVPVALIKKPKMPKSTASTPKPSNAN